MLKSVCTYIHATPPRRESYFNGENHGSNTRAAVSKLGQFRSPPSPLYINLLSINEYLIIDNGGTSVTE